MRAIEFDSDKCIRIARFRIDDFVTRLLKTMFGILFLGLEGLGIAFASKLNQVCTLNTKNQVLTKAKNRVCRLHKNVRLIV